MARPVPAHGRSMNVGGVASPRRGLLETLAIMVGGEVVKKIMGVGDRLEKIMGLSGTHAHNHTCSS